jgi:hypothetical protein
MTTTKSKTKASSAKTKVGSKTASSQAKSRTPKLVRGLPGTARERAKALRRLAEEHSETLVRLGK